MDELVKAMTLVPEPWAASRIVLHCVLAFLLGLFIAAVYRSTQRQLVLSFR